MRLFLYCLAFWSCIAGASVPVAPLKVTLSQPNGHQFVAHSVGHKENHWLETSQGHRVILNDGIWQYVVIDSLNREITSDVAVGKASNVFLSQLPNRAQFLSLALAKAKSLPSNEQTIWSKAYPNGEVIYSAGGSVHRVAANGQQNLLILMTAFADESFKYSASQFSNLIFGDGGVKGYFQSVSEQTLTIQPATETQGTNNDGIVEVALTINHPNTRNGSDEMVQLAFAGADQFINYADYDSNNDGNISTDELSIVIIAAGYENSFGGVASLTPSLWGHKSSISNVTLDGVTLSPYVALGERHATNASNEHISTMGIIAHELGHLVFDLPDLYDIDDSSEGIGEWGLMGGGSWNSQSNESAGASPAGMLSWSRIKSGFANANTVETSTALNVTTANSDMIKLWLDKYRLDEYLMLENRRQSGVDVAIPGQGLLISHIDESQTTNADESKRLVNIEAADGAMSIGDAGDTFGNDASAFNNSTVPATTNNAGLQTGVAINNIGQPGQTIAIGSITPMAAVGDNLSYNEKRQTGRSIGFNSPSVFSAIEFTNTTNFEQIDGFEVYLPEAGEVTFYLYDSISGNTLGTRLHSQSGFNAQQGWNRFLLNTPQQFPNSSNVVMVLEIALTSANFPASYDSGDTAASGKSYVASGLNSRFTEISSDFGDLNQHILLGQNESLLQWRSQTGGTVLSSPAVALDGTIYVGSSDNSLYAYNSDGAKKWQLETGGAITASPVVGTDGTIYIGSLDNKLYAVNPDNGSIKWEFDSKNEISATAALSNDGKIYVATVGGTLYAVSDAGAMLWQYDVEGAAINSGVSVAVDGTLYIDATDGQVHAISPEGLRKWRANKGSVGASSFAIGNDNTIYIGLQGGQLLALTTTGTEKWRFDAGSAIDSSPAVGSDGSVYFGADDGVVYALDSQGTLSWRFETGGAVNSSPAIGSDGSIYVGSDDDLLYALTGEGTLKWRYSTGGNISSSPAIGSDGTLYVGSDDTFIYALVTNSNGPADAPWPMFGKNNQHINRLSGDSDGDGVVDDVDNCPAISNTDQLNSDGADDGGNACDSDDDNDGFADSEDAFPVDGSEWLDTDKDGIGNNTDNDDDNDGIVDIEDDYPLDATKTEFDLVSEVVFKDTNLQSCVVAAAASNNWVNAKAVTELNCASKSIADLQGINAFDNLTSLLLSDNQINDIALLAQLKLLTKLDVRRNALVDLSPLSDLTLLNELKLAVNKIVDLTALANLTELTFLSLSDNSFSGSMLGELSAMSKLERLYLRDSGLTDLSDLSALSSLKQLFISGNKLQSIDALSGLTSLTKLHLFNNRISDISILSAMGSLTSLRLHYNQISDISPLSALTSLTDLKLAGNQLSDIAVLAGLTQLTSLSLNNNQLSNIDVLSNLTSAQSINLRNNPNVSCNDISSLTATLGETVVIAPAACVDIAKISFADSNLAACVQSAIAADNALQASDITELSCPSLAIEDLTGLEALTQLNTLLLSGNQIVNLTAISELVNLTTLDLRRNQLVDVKELQNLTQLTQLKLAKNFITDVSALENTPELILLSASDNLFGNSAEMLSVLTKLSNLQTLYLRNTQINDISWLANLTLLSELYLSNNSISDLTVLVNLTGLTKLYLSNNDIADISPLSALTALTKLRLNGNQIFDVGAVSGMAGMTSILLNGNSITNIEPLFALRAATEINLRRNNSIECSLVDELEVALSGATIHRPAACVDILSVSFADSGLDGCMFEAIFLNGWSTAAQVTEFACVNSNVSSLSGLEHFTELTSLDLRNNQINAIGELGGMTSLTELKLTNNQMTNLNTLDNLRALTFLSISGNPFGDDMLNALINLDKLEALYLRDNNLTDIAPVAKFTFLTRLYMRNNQINDLSPVSQLSNLRLLRVANNAVTDVSPLFNLTGVENINLSDNDNISCDQLDSLIAALGNEKVTLPNSCI